jgi:type I restriction enzyme R subunit
LSEEVFADMAVQVEAMIEKHKIRDWENNLDGLNQMRNAIEDYLYDIEKTQDIRFSNVELDEIIEQVIDIARKRA